MQPGWIVDGGQEGGRFGVSVIGAGDINQDGYDDVVVGAYRYDDKYVDEGRGSGLPWYSGGLRSLPFWSVGPSGGERLEDDDGDAGGQPLYMPYLQAGQ